MKSRNLLLVLLMGCGGKAEVAIGPDTTNYDFCSELTADSTDVAPNTDITIDWSDLDTSLLGEPIAAGEINVVSILRAPDLTQTDLLQRINDGTIATADFDAFASYAPTTETSALASQFELNGTAIVPATDIFEGATYLASVGHIDETSGITSYYMFTFFNPTAAEDNTTVLVTSDSAALSYTVDIDASAFPVPFGQPAVHIDWASLELNGCDDEIDLSDIDTVLVARYDEPIADIEGDFLNVQALAEESYVGDVTGFGDAWLDLVLEDEAGNAFPGFDDNGTWLVALICSTCLNPAPPFLAQAVEE